MSPSLQPHGFYVRPIRKEDFYADDLEGPYYFRRAGVHRDVARDSRGAVRVTFGDPGREMLLGIIAWGVTLMLVTALARMAGVID